MNNREIELKKIISMMLTAIIVLSTFLAAASAETIKVTVRDANTGEPINNSTVWFANGTSSDDRYNLYQQIFEHYDTSANGTVIYSDANTPLSHFIKATGGDNLSTPGADYRPFWGHTALQFLNLTDITRYDADDIQNFSITYVNNTWIEVDAPVRRAANLSVTTDIPLPLQKGMRAIKLGYEIWSYGYNDYATEDNYKLNRTIPELNTSWNITDIVNDVSIEDYANITTIYGGDNNDTLKFVMTLKGPLTPPNNYSYRILINTTAGIQPFQPDFIAEYNGSTSNSYLGMTGVPEPLEQGIATIQDKNISFVFDRMPLANFNSFNVSARTENITNPPTNDTIQWQQYYFNTTYSPRRNYNVSVMTTTDDIAVKNSTGWVNYSKLSDLTNMPLQQGNVRPVSLTLERGYNVSFTGPSSSLSDLTIEVRNHTTNDGAPFNDSIITLIRNYNQPNQFYENVSLPNGTYDFVFKTWNNISTWNSTIINGTNVVVVVPNMPALPQQQPHLEIMPDVIKVGQNISGQIRFMLPSSTFNATNYSYSIYNTSADKTVKLVLKKNETLTSSSFEIPSTGLPAGEYSLIVAAQNTSVGVNQSLLVGSKFALVNASLDFFMDFTASPSGLVNVTITARNSTRDPIPNMKIDMDIIDPSSGRFWTIVKASNTTSANGETKITFPAPAKSGRYFLRFTGSSSSSPSYFARDYRPLMVQDFSLKAYTDKEMYKLNGTVTVNMRATYFNGTPISGVTINTTVHWSPDVNWDLVNTSISTATTDTNGKANITYQINRTGPCMFEFDATKGNMNSFAEAFAFVPKFDITVSTDKWEYYPGDKVNVTIIVKNETEGNVTGLQFYNTSQQFSDPSEVVQVAMSAGKNGTAFVFNPMEGWAKTVNLTGTSSYTGSYNTTDLLPGPDFYAITVILFDPNTGMPTAFAFTDFELKGNLRIMFSSEKDIFKPYKLNDTVNLSVIVSYVNGTQVAGGNLNYSVGMPWEIFMPPQERAKMGLGGPRVDSNTTITHGTAWINFTLDPANFTGNTSIPEAGMKKIGTPPFIIKADARDNGNRGTEVFPIFVTDLNVMIKTDKFMYNPSETVTFSINVTNATGPVNVTFQTPYGGTNEMSVFGPTAEHTIAVTQQSTGNYTATYNTGEDVAGEHFGFAMVTDGTSSAGKGVPFFVKRFDVDLRLVAGSDITATVNASVSYPATVDAALFSPTNKILYFNTTLTSTLPISFNVSIPSAVPPGLYSIKSRITGADGNVGVEEKSFAVTNPGIQVTLLLQNATGANTTSFTVGNVVNMTVYFTGINSTTIRIFNNSGLIFIAVGLTNGASTQFVPTVTGVYYVRVDTPDAIGVASKAFVVT